MRELSLGFSNPVGAGGVFDVCPCLGCGGVGGVGGLDQGLERWGGVMSVYVDYLCRWQVQVYVYCAWQIPAHLGCT